MIREIPINEPHILAIRISGKLLEKDANQFRDRLKKLLEKEKKLLVLIKLEEFEGWSGKAAWDDIKIGLGHDEEILRIAIVGEKSWLKIMNSIETLFINSNIRYFDDEAIALEWLKEIKNRAERDEYQGYRHILVATDFSRFSETALKKATEIATPFNAKITLLHAAEILSSEIYPSMGELSIPVLANNPELEEKQLQRVQKKLDTVREKIDYPDRLVSSRVKMGHPVDSIMEYAMKNDVDLIVMGSHGRRGLARLLGSSTNGVINQAPCDILTVV